MPRKNESLTFILGLAAGAWLGYSLGRRFAGMWRPLETGQLTENVYAVRSGNVNLFVCTDGVHTVAIDAAANPDVLRREFNKINITPQAVTHLFLTHSDFDHAGGLEAFPNAQIHLPQDEAQMIDRTTPRMLRFYYNPKIERPYTLLRDGDTVEVGNLRVRAIATPGHTPGAMSFLLNDRILFTGDTLALRNGRVHPFFRLLNVDTARQEASIRTLAQLKDIDLLCTAHTGCSHDYAFAMQDWRRVHPDRNHVKTKLGENDHGQD